MRASFLAFVQVFALLVLGARTALACGPSWSVSTTRLLGVDPDGNAVRYSDGLGDDSDGANRTFTVVDKQGFQFASMTLEEETITANDPSGYFDAFLESSSADAGIVGAALTRTKRLSPAVPKRRLRHVKSEARCGSIEIESKSGWLRIAEVGVLSYQFEETCPPLHLEALEHPASELIFVRVKYHLGASRTDDSDSGYVHSDQVMALPRHRVKGAELAILGERARSRGRLDQAIPMLEDAVRLAPEIVSTRSSLIRAYARAGREWDVVEAVLDTPLPQEAGAIGAAPSAELIASLSNTWDEAADREGAWPWQELAEPSLHRSF